ncbi:MAG TPA: Ig-like domain-containing protein [Candidatus Wunengus sp. YC65]|uniref:Ig-like domain-containing protein n=1 Tax=Candidatus Wunengus sp. YC65 TaxID=3367701 RepID=UPI004028FC1C
MNLKFFCKILFIFLCTFPLRNIHAQLADSPWPMFRHDLKHTGRSSYTGSSKNYLQWVYPVGSSTSTPAIGTDSTIYVGSYDSNLYAINPDGTLKWKYKTDDTIESSPAVGTDGVIYVGSNDNKVYAINPDGTLKWSYTTKDNVASSPAVGTNSTVYVGSYDGNLYAINKDGTLKKDPPPSLGNQIYSSPAVGSNEILYIGSRNDRYFYSLDSNLGTRWRLRLLDLIDSSPAIGGDGTVYIGADKLYAFTESGSYSGSNWPYKTTNGLSITSSPAISTGDNIYFGAESGFYALYSTGNVKSIVNTIGAIGKSSPAIDASGNVYICTNSGLHALDTTNYAVKWTYPIKDENASPIIGADGTIYVHSSDGKLYAVGTSSAVVKTIATDKTSLNIVEGKSGTITATTYDANDLSLSDVVLNASVESELVATVSPGSSTTDANGQAVFTVDGNAVGEANLSITTNSTSTLIPITISQKSGLVVNSLDITPSKLTVAKNASGTITVKTLDANETRIPNVYINVSNNNTSSVSIEGGKVTDDIAEASFLVTGIEEGSASITFTADSISGTSTVSVIAPKTIALESTSLSVKEHESAAVTTTVEDANGNDMADQSVSAVSADTSIASVDAQQTTDENGNASFTVTGNSIGNTTVTFTSGSATTALSVSVVSGGVLTSLDIEPDKLSIILSYSGTATVTALDQDNNSMTGIDIAATSDDTNIVTVDNSQTTNADGQAFFSIHTLSAGSATIDFTADSISNSLPVSVLNTVPSSLVLSKKKLNVYLGQTGTITATVLDQNNSPISDINVEANSSDTGIATIDPNKATDDDGKASFGITGKSEGETEVTLSVGTLTASASVTVIELIPSSIFIDESLLKLSQCESGSVTVSVFDDTGVPISDVTVNASVSKNESQHPHIHIDNSSVVTDEGGESSFFITGLRKGGATITFNVDTIRKKLKVRVNKARIVSVETTDSITIKVLQGGEPKSGVTITAESSDTDVVLVTRQKKTNAKGEAKFIITGVEEGSATITFTTSTGSSSLKENITVIKTAQMELSEKDLSISAGTSQSITVTASDANSDSVTDTTVYATVISGEKNVEVTPSEQTTDENGSASFTIKGIKAGNARIEIGVCGMSEKLKVEVLP